ncbi:MAG TPA: ABC transporter substrate-binding protein [Actinophytocola sp.]|uniref:ABC transporter substrate-binding protein n=1 Tax=Actinophytocola sp. TaxID=1872138 RepID=UPI002DBE42BA|nr:ABC transporter substrate-binding protein [Actinophytocola sp.]HEU5475932.1 ABC transporter substrate-binding protein [Actinophytocola sp.]
MRRRGLSRREFLGGVVVLGGGGLVLGGCSSPVAPPESGPGGGGGRGGGPRAGLPDIEGAEVVLDPARFPKAFREAPELAKLVAEGKLPPVDQRVGSDPLVLKPVHGVGRYGGQIRRGFIGQSDFQNAVRFCSGPDSLLYWDYRFEKLVPNIARGFELSEDGRVLTLQLRKGMKWSDGQPLTADDIVFWFTSVASSREVGTGSSSMKIGGQDVKVERVDEFTVRYVSPAPNPLLPQRMAGSSDIAGMAGNAHLGGGGFMPKHYLSQFHPEYTSMDAANKLAADAGFKGWAAYFRNQASWHRNPALPVVTPWVLTRPISNPPWEFGPNPYSIWVDHEGNQLPYISKITMGNIENTEVLGLRAAAGDYDVQDRGLGVTNLPVLLENEKKSAYTIHRAPSTELDCGLRLNLAYEQDKELGELIRTVEFRRALSLGIDRGQVNEAFFLGTCTPSATMVAEGSIYDPGPEWHTKWATYDVAQANTLLDGLGLTAKDAEGYRLRKDGAGRIRLDFQAFSNFADFVGVGEMVKRQWQQIGIDLNVASVEGSLLTQRANSNQLMLSCQQVGSDDPFLRPEAFLPTVTTGFPGMIGIPYAQWFASGGAQGKEPPESLRLKEAMALYDKGQMEPDEAERIRIGKEIYKLHADQVWSIGLVGFGLSANGVYLTSNKLRNVPARVVNSQTMKSLNNTYPMTYYYE